MTDVKIDTNTAHGKLAMLVAQGIEEDDAMFTQSAKDGVIVPLEARAGTEMLREALYGYLNACLVAEKTDMAGLLEAIRACVQHRNWEGAETGIAAAINLLFYKPEVLAIETPKVWVRDNEATAKRWSEFAPAFLPISSDIERWTDDQVKALDDYIAEVEAFEARPRPVLPSFMNLFTPF